MKYLSRILFPLSRKSWRQARGGSNADERVRATVLEGTETSIKQSRLRRRLAFERFEERVPLAVLLQQNFSGLDFDETACRCSPPDTQMAVGPSSVITGVNTAFMIQSKTGEVIAGPTEGSTFFASVIQPDQSYRGDPQVVYDSIANRFYLAGFELSGDRTHGSFDLAVSKTSNPTSLTTADWYLYRFDSVAENGTQFPDFPKLGFNKDGIFVSFNQFFYGLAFTHNLILTIDKPSVLSGGAPVSYSSSLFTGSATRLLIPARMHGHSSVDAMLFVQKDFNELDTINVVKMTNYRSNDPVYTTTTFNVKPYDQSPGVLGLTYQIDDRMLSASWIGDKLVAAHNVGVDGKNVARWYQFNAPLSGTPTLVQQGDIDAGPGVSTSYPSIGINPAGDIALTFVQNVATRGASMYVTGRTNLLPLGVMQVPRLVKAGGLPPETFRGGDYSATEFDPVEPASFWSANQYQNGNTQFNVHWGTQVAKYRITDTPLIVGSTPSPETAGPVASATFKFDVPMNPASFSLASDVLSFTGPTGVNLKPSITGFSFNATNTILTISFAPITLTGDYRLVLGPQIVSAGLGLALDNNANGIGGEAGVDNLNLTFKILNLFCESFDRVTEPNLPIGWTSVLLNGSQNFVTTASSSVSGKNSVYIPNPDSRSGVRLESPIFTYSTTNKRVIFQHRFKTEDRYDGGHLEISIAGGPFEEITRAGGSFLSGGYNAEVFSDGIGGPMAWSGNSGGYIETQVVLPDAAAGLSVRLGWRFGSDGYNGGEGWNIDDVCLPTVPTTVSLTPVDADKREGTFALTPFTFALTRAGVLTGETFVEYQVFPHGSHPAKSLDFFPYQSEYPGGVIRFAPNEFSKSLTFTVDGDPFTEADTAFLVKIMSASNGAVVVNESAIGTIRNDDSYFQTSPNVPELIEGSRGANPITLTVVRSGVVNVAETIDFKVTAGLSDSVDAGDFVGGVFPSGRIAFAVGETHKTFTINVNGDTTVEPDESFIIEFIQLVDGVSLTSRTYGTLRNDDSAASTLSIAPLTADRSEGNAGGMVFSFIVTRGGNLGATTTAGFAVTVTGNSAASGSDFIAGAFPTGTVTFAPGETSKTISFSVAGDTLVELDETFRVTLSAAVGTNVSIVGTPAVGTIRNDDSAFVVSATSADKPEGHSGPTPFTFTIGRTGLRTSPASVSYVVVGSTANAANVFDFVGSAFPQGIVAFNAGEASKLVTINVNGDLFVENPEWFTLNLSAPSAGVTIAAGSAIGVIRNDDSMATTLSIAALSANKPEGNSGATAFTFTVVKNGNSSTMTSVGYNVVGSGGSPASAGDFANGVLPSGLVVFAAGETSKTVTLQVAGDLSIEPDEYFQVQLSNPTFGTTISVASASGTIANDDRSNLLSMSCGLLIVGPNTCTVSGATPGAFVTFARGEQTGATPIPNTGLTLGIANPNYFATGIVGADGRVSVVLTLTQASLGRPILIGAFQQAPVARLSEVISRTVVATAPTSSLTIASPSLANSAAASITTRDVLTIQKIATSMWIQYGVTSAELQKLQSTTIRIADLSSGVLAEQLGTTITLDANASDHGWFVDKTPWHSDEFVRQRTVAGQPFQQREMRGRESGPADRQLDLLTVVLHELGRAIGRDAVNTPIPLMQSSLAPGVRKLLPGFVE